MFNNIIDNIVVMKYPIVVETNMFCFYRGVANRNEKSIRTIQNRFNVDSPLLQLFS
jgi:hypothetical protein